MGKHLNKIKNAGQIGKTIGANAGNRINKFANRQVNVRNRINDGKIKEQRPQYMDESFDDKEFEDDLEQQPYDDFDDVNIQKAQKPESFHHFLLENKYKDLEMNIRGYKDVFNKEKEVWEVKRRKRHCFNDEESEDILRTAQSHLSTDIKLTFYSKETFGLRFLAVYDEIEKQFKRIMEYKFGRHGDEKTQGEMKAQAVKIFVDLITRIEANYLMARAGMENKRTHEAVRSQESLQGGNDEILDNRRYS